MNMFEVFTMVTMALCFGYLVSMVFRAKSIFVGRYFFPSILIFLGTATMLGELAWSYSVGMTEDVERRYNLLIISDFLLYLGLFLYAHDFFRKDIKASSITGPEQARLGSFPLE